MPDQTAGYRLSAYAEPEGIPQSLALPTATEEQADNVARALRDAMGPKSIVDVYRVHADGREDLTGFFWAGKANA